MTTRPRTSCKSPRAPPASRVTACPRTAPRWSGPFNGSASPWGTFDTATGASIFTYGVNPNDGPNGSGFQAIAPDGSLVLWGQERGYPYLSLSPFNAGNELAQLNPGGGFPVHPAWSSDGKKIAFAVRSDGNWLDFTSSTLWITDVDMSAKSFSNTKQIVAPTATPGRATVTFPTFSPDSSWIAFERSTQARSRGALSDVWLTTPTARRRSPSTDERCRHVWQVLGSQLDLRAHVHAGRGGRLLLDDRGR